MKAAVIGIGNIAQVHIATLLEQKIEIVALCDIDLFRCKKAVKDFKLKAKIYSNYKEMLDNEEIDVVHVCTPHYLHAEMVRYALDKNINCLCEKPLAINQKQLDQIKASVFSSKAQLGLCMQRRFEPAVVTLKDVYKNEKIMSGHVSMSWCRDEKYYKADSWRGKWKTEGGALMINQALHYLDIMFFLMGYPDSVIAHTWNDTLKGVIQCDESAFAIFKYNDGRRFTLQATNANSSNHGNDISIIGTKNVAYYIGDSLVINDKQIKCKMNTPVLGKKEWGTGHNYVFESFYKCVKEGKQFTNDYNVGANIVKAILAIYKSKGKEIKLSWEK